MRRAALRSLACLGLLAAAACPAPSDVTPLIHVDPKAAGRLDWIASHAPQPRAPQVAPARVHVMKAGEQLGGPNAVGRPGDLLLENDEVAFVVDQLASSLGFAESGGNVVDAADARARKDELGQQFTYFGTFPRQGVYAALATGAEADGSAWIEARGHELYEAALVVTTRYTLHAPDRALLVETTLENTGDAPAALPSLGDAIQWGGAEKVAPGKPRGFKGASSGPYVGAVGRLTSYAITSTEGALDAVSGAGWTDTVQRKDVKIAAHGKTSYARVLVVGARADTSSLVGELAMAAGEPVGALRVTMPPVPTGVKVQLLRAGASEPMTLGEPFAAMIPLGTYTVSVAGRAAPAPVEVKADGEARAALAVDPAASLAVTCAAPGGGAMPCKVTVEGAGATATPDFGPPHAAGPARNQATTADGSVEVALLAGSYRVTASRGPEYALAQADVTLSPGERRALTLSPERVVDTAGYVACDFHQHTMESADAPVSRVDRVISNAAEGVEVAVTSEHNVVVDLEPIVHELHLDDALVVLPGDELTTDASRKPWGHANVWPLPFDPTKPRGGATPVRDRPAHEVFEALRAGPDAVPGRFVLQINHPRLGTIGYFEQLKLDRARGVGTEPGYDAAFDALEVWNGRNVDGRAAVIDDWRALLRTGHPVTATADTDTHGVVGQEAGYPRTMVRVADDAHLGAWDAAHTADLVEGVKTRRDVVLTNGPMLRVTANGVPVGGLARGRDVTVRVHVESAPWVDVDAVRLVRASEGGTAGAAGELVKKVTLRPIAGPSKAPGQAAREAHAARANGADVTFVVRVDRDDALFVEASGSRPMTPVLAGDEREITPWAMTGAIWIDADGDAKALGR